MPRSVQQQMLVDRTIDEALSRAGLSVESPVRALLDRDAEVYDTGRELAVHVPRPDRSISLAERLEEIKCDPMFAHNFPTDPFSVSKRDVRKLSEHFADIASGKVIVK